MKTDTINVEDLTKWMNEQKLLFADDIRAKKKLFCTLTGNFEVHHKGVVILNTNNAQEAVEKYNEVIGRIEHENDLTIEKLLEFRWTGEIISPKNKNIDKQLYCTITGDFEVWFNGNKVSETSSAYKAIYDYNILK